MQNLFMIIGFFIICYVGNFKTLIRVLLNLLKEKIMTTWEFTLFHFDKKITLSFTK